MRVNDWMDTCGFVLAMLILGIGGVITIWDTRSRKRRPQSKRSIGGCLFGSRYTSEDDRAKGRS